MPGVIGLAAMPDSVFVATPTKSVASRLTARKSSGPVPKPYRGIRRLAATPAEVYVCDTAASVVDKLDAKSGELLGRLGVAGETGSALDRLNHPYTVAADLNGVYIADNGNGRVLVATTSLWRRKSPACPATTVARRGRDAPLPAAAGRADECQCVRPAATSPFASSLVPNLPINR